MGSSEWLACSILNSNERWPNVKLELIPGRDHTLRPLYSQERAHEALDRALDRELARGTEI